MSILIQTYHPTIVDEDEVPVCSAKLINNWGSIKPVALDQVIIRRFDPSPDYIGTILIPSLNINVPLANYSNDRVYTFGAGMLIPHRISSNHDLVIGAHNLGWRKSSALFTPLAFNQLAGRRVFVTDFTTVKQYEIISRRIISSANVDAPFRPTGFRKLVLLTCTNDNKRRILVTAKLTKSFRIQELDRRIQKKIQRKYKTNSINKNLLNA